MDNPANSYLTMEDDTEGWVVWSHECLNCGMNLMTVTPASQEPIIKLCQSCRTSRMDQCKAAEFDRG